MTVALAITPLTLKNRTHRLIRVCALNRKNTVSYHAKSIVHTIKKLVNALRIDVLVTTLNIYILQTWILFEIVHHLQKYKFCYHRV